ncbi:MAG: hypothetical protein IJG38_05080 [Thermoguttaceae bacterium]|nr:hypothetical protein [Thermoguttaceae bacterium]
MFNFNGTLTYRSSYAGDEAVFAAGQQLAQSAISCVPQRWERNADGTPSFTEEEGASRKKDITFKQWRCYADAPLTVEAFKQTWEMRDANTLTLVLTRNAGSPGLYAFDFDQDAERIFPDYLSKVGSFMDTDQLYIEHTISGGYHLIVRLENAEDTPETEHYAYPSDKGKPYIESRGYGGFIIIAPSYGYAVAEGFCDSLDTLKPITSEQFFKLEATAREYNEYPPSADDTNESNSERRAGLTPGNDYNQRATMESVLALLKAHGWQEAYTDNSTGNVHLTRPGKAGGTSATLQQRDGVPVFYVFSSSCKGFEPDRAYSPFAIYTILCHESDFTKAAQELLRMGYGEMPIHTDEGERERFINGIWLQVDKTGTLLRNLTNAQRIFLGAAKYTDMAAHNELMGCTSLIRYIDNMPPGKRLDEDLLAYLLCDINNRYEGLRFSENDLCHAFRNVWNHKSFNPFKEFVDNCDWDGTPRLDELLINCFGSDDTLLVREAISKLLIAAYARQVHPGMKFDYALILLGPEGTGKSTFVSKLFDPLQLGDCGWYCDAMTMEQLTHDTKFVEGSAGKIGIELAELAGMSRAAVEELKRALTCTRRQFRKAYGRETKAYLMRQVFIGTTNEECFLTSQTGNRRFWVVRVRSNHVFDVLTRDYVKQVWGEVKRRYDSLCDADGYFDPSCLLLSRAADSEACTAQQNARVREPWEGSVARYLGAVSEYKDIERTDGGIMATPVYSRSSVQPGHDIWTAACVPIVHTEQFKKAESSRLASFMLTHLHWRSGRATINRTQVRGYIRPDSDSKRVFIPITALPCNYHSPEAEIPAKLNADIIDGYQTTPQYWNF